MASKQDIFDAGISRESIFRGLIKERYCEYQADTKDSKLIGKLQGLTDLQERLHKNSQLKLECLRLANFAPRDVKESVKAMVNKKSKYIDY